MSAGAAETKTNPTPFLDRLVPLPEPRKSRGSASFLAGSFWIICFFLFIVVLLALLPPLEQQFFRLLGRSLSIVFKTDWAGIRIILTVFLMGLAVLGGVVIHELGHLLAGRAAGFRFESLRIAGWQIDQNLKVSRCQTAQGDGLGATIFSPNEMRNRPLRVACMVAAGPAADLLLGSLLLILPFHKSLITGSFILACWFFGLGNLVPFRSGNTISDGMRLFMLLWKPAKYERLLALAQIITDYAAGLDSEALSPDLLASAVAVQDRSLFTVLGHSFAFAAAYNQHNDHEAARLLEVCLQYAGFASPYWREALITNAGVFQAERRKRIDLARAWLADFPATPIVPYRRLMIEGAILETEGNLAEVLQKIDAIEAAIKANAGNSEAAKQRTLRGFVKWRAELEQKLRSGDSCSVPGS